MKTNDTEANSTAAGSRVGADLGAARQAPRLPTARPEVGPYRDKPSRLWLWFVAAFLIQGVAWAAWFVIASQNRVQEVPLATAR